MEAITYKKSITVENVNPFLEKMEFAVKGPLFHRLSEIETSLKEHKLPFKKVIKGNIGDSHAVGQTPISFIRQVLACISYPKLMENDLFPQDVKVRAAAILDGCSGNSIGSYTPSIGIDNIRQSVAKYICKRDGYKADWNNIYLTPGATAAIKNCLELLTNEIDGKTSGVMIPIPQYPIYSASIEEYGLQQVHYYLDESLNWGLTFKELERSVKDGSHVCNVRALVVINPGNPTGQILTRENIKIIIKFAYKYSLLIIADEVYQHNVYEGKFYSFKMVLMEMGLPYNQVELISIMSTSKGYMGECGLRGGWMEIVNMDPEVQIRLYKCINAKYCPNTLGQAVVDCVAKPPIKGDASFELYLKEKDEVLHSLRHRAKLVVDMFNKIEGFSCNTLQGAMYAFPRFDMPRKAIEAAMKEKQEPDEFYALKLLEETGICVLPGSGFGQEPGTYHIRTTILPKTELLVEMGNLLHTFHEKFVKEYS